MALYLLWRARKQPEYLAFWRQRWGFFTPSDLPTMRGNSPDSLRLWLHAVSVGETRAALPLIKALLAKYPSASLVLTHGTPTGREVGNEICAQFPERVVSVYLPYDYPGAQRRFLAYFRPQLGLIMEAEVWPNLMAAAKSASIKVLLLNARLSDKSLRKGLAQRRLIEPALNSFHAIYAQSQADAKRLASLGAQATVLGNVKFDMMLDTQMQALGRLWRTIFSGKKIVMLASSREGEEALILDAWARFQPALSTLQQWQLLIVPRHPQRFDEVAKLLKDRGFKVTRRTSPQWQSAQTESEVITKVITEANTVLLGDSMGEMQAYYSLASLAMMGGTLNGFGGQNLIESCALACPVVLGPSTYNFAQAAKDALAKGAALQGNSVDEVLTAALTWMADEHALQHASTMALRFADEHRGALDAHLEQISLLITQQ